MIILNSEHLQQITTHAENSYPEECCGLLLGIITQKDRQVVEVRETENSWNLEEAEQFPFTSGTKRDRFSIAPQVLLAVQKEVRQRQLAIVGVYHSHPDHKAIPSEYDRLIAWPEYIYLIVSVCQGQATDFQGWQLNDEHQFEPEEIVTR